MGCPVGNPYPLSLEVATFVPADLPGDNFPRGGGGVPVVMSAQPGGVFLLGQGPARNGFLRLLAYIQAVEGLQPVSATADAGRQMAHPRPPVHRKKDWGRGFSAAPGPRSSLYKWKPWGVPIV